MTDWIIIFTIEGELFSFALLKPWGLKRLDFNRKRYVLSSIKNIQTIITCTGIEDLTNYLDENSKVFRVSDGVIRG